MGKYLCDKILYINLALQTHTFILEPFLFFISFFCVEFGVTVEQGNSLTLCIKVVKVIRITKFLCFFKHRLCFNDWFYIYGIMKLIVFQIYESLVKLSVFQTEFQVVRATNTCKVKVTCKVKPTKKKKVFYFYLVVWLF